jgi:hypothetical protein
VIGNQDAGRSDAPSEPTTSSVPPWATVGAHLPSPEDTPPTAASRIASIALALVVGVVYGAVGTVAHPLSVTLGSIAMPYGLVLALVGVLALFVGFRLVLGERLATVGAVVGVVGIVALFSLESRGGSVLIQEGLPGMVWLLGPALLGAIVISWPSLPERRRRLDGPEAKEFPTP